MTIKTKNSTYRVTAKGDHFIVEKIAEVVPNPNGIGIGWTRKCKRVSMDIGEGAFFGDTIYQGIHTTEILEVLNDKPRSL